MSRAIDAILFDMGGTLSYTTENDESGRNQLIAQLQELVGSSSPLAEFTALLLERGRAYRQHAKATMRELDETRIWTEWMLPEHPPEQVAALAPQLNLLFLRAMRLRFFLPGAQETVLELFRRGYRLGLVSNTTSTREALDLWEGAGMAGIFETVLLSCNFGLRKPDPAMLAAAASQLEVAPERCAYVGDRPDRDVAAARQAGYGQAIIIHHNLAEPFLPQDEFYPPDHLVAGPAQLLDLFPPRAAAGSQPARQEERTVWDASLSSMWAIGNFPRLDDFYRAARRIGFSGIELNHQVTNPMLDGSRANGTCFRSIHEPCPADISTDELKKRDWLLSATDEDCRQQGLLAVKRSIDLAKNLGARTVVIHAGNIHYDLRLEKRLCALWESGGAGTDEFAEVRGQLVASCQALLRPRLEAIKKSLRALLDYAGMRGIRLGLENRNHYTDLPGLNEMGELLELADAGRLGFIFDTGHARALEILGFSQTEEWLKRYADRLYGVHLHDMQGLYDHLVPGSGEIDFGRLGAYLPGDAFRTLELRPSISACQIRAGLNYLHEKGCVTCTMAPN